VPGADPLEAVRGFDWDSHNAEKVRVRHGVLTSECEEVFLSGPLVVPDSGHSANEPRYAAFGATRTGRRLAIFFTVRASRVRVVTARDPSRKERREVQHAQEAQADSGLP
jgi:uncharacterized DUF497 family protein